jgi:hypothetical protein
MDKGFGTAYEKFIINDIFADLVDKYQIKTVCEFPSNNLMENNSDEFESLGCKVTRQFLGDGKTSDRFDLVWCFCELEQRDNPFYLVEKMIEKSNRFVLIVTQNKRNIGVPLHYIYHILSSRSWDHGRLKYMTTSIVEQSLPEKYVSIVQRGAFDVPWFILDVYEAGSLLLRFIPKKLLNGKEIKPSLFEHLPFAIKKWLSHHVYLLIEKNADLDNLIKLKTK